GPLSYRCGCFFFQAEDGIRDRNVTGVQTCALPILMGVGEFAGYVQLVPGDPGLGDRPAHAALGAVGLRRVEMTVPGPQCLGDDRGGDLRIGVAVLAIGAESERSVAELRSRRSVAAGGRR